MGSTRKTGESETPSVPTLSERSLFLSLSAIQFLKSIYRDGGLFHLLSLGQNRGKEFSCL